MTTITRRSLVLGAMAVPIARSALSQPATGNITRIVVPFPPGGTVDPIARMVQPGLQQWLGTIIVIENKPGASGSIGHRTGREVPAGWQQLGIRVRHSCGQSLSAEPFGHHREGPGTGAANRHR